MATSILSDIAHLQIYLDRGGGVGLTACWIRLLTIETPPTLAPPFPVRPGSPTNLPTRCGLEHEIEAGEARKYQVPYHACCRVAHFRRGDHANDGRGTSCIRCLQCLDAEASEHLAAMAHDRPVGWSAGNIFLQGDCWAVAVKTIKVGKIELLDCLLQRCDRAS